MATITEPMLEWTARDLFRRFGPIPIARIRLNPPPGSATEDDVVAIRDREKRLCELVDGILVEKAMGWNEARLATEIATSLNNFTRATPRRRWPRSCWTTSAAESSWSGTSTPPS